MYNCPVKGGIMTIDEMLERKRELGYTYETISELADLPLGTVQKVLGKITKSPRYETIQALESVLKPSAPPGNGISLVREGTAAYSGTEPAAGCYPLLPYKSQGEYTAEDREQLPEDVRTELIDGVLYDLAAPRPVHQIIVGNVYAKLNDCINKAGKDCLAFLAPSDVWLDRDCKTVVQPDIYVICDYSMIGNKKHTMGPPAFVAEVLSPSTRSRDMLLKAYKYCTAGVREYWVIDPERRKILVYNYDTDPDGTVYTEYGFADTVPVGISGGCAVDFGEITGILEKAGLF